MESLKSELDKLPKISNNRTIENMSNCVVPLIETNGNLKKNTIRSQIYNKLNIRLNNQY